ncbi:hypothetical protein [Nannocystis pusilla]|uniref:hypothetical protein n=1 Tax=Nannocystis pusilla TaxID=889268 RepID=UPI003B7BDBFC
MVVEVTTGSSPGPLVGLGVVEVVEVVVTGADVAPSLVSPVVPSVSVALVSKSTGREAQPTRASQAIARHVPWDMFLKTCRERHAERTFARSVRGGGRRCGERSNS